MQMMQLARNVGCQPTSRLADGRALVMQMILFHRSVGCQRPNLMVDAGR